MDKHQLHAGRQKHDHCTTECASSLPANWIQMLIKTRLSTTPSVAGKQKSLMLNWQHNGNLPRLKIQGTVKSVQPDLNNVIGMSEINRWL